VTGSARDLDVTATDRITQATIVVAAFAILVSGWVHFSLYFRGGYRGISPDDIAGITISRAFALNAIAAVVIAEALVLSVRLTQLRLPAAVAGTAFAAATVVAYTLSRTRGLLGFTETSTTAKAVIALIAEIIAILTLVPIAVATQRERHPPIDSPG
jgi:hypothetical protein